MRSAYGWGKGEGGGGELKEDCDDLMVALRVKTTCEVSMGGGWRVGLKEDSNNLIVALGVKIICASVYGLGGGGETKRIWQSPSCCQNSPLLISWVETGTKTRHGYCMAGTEKRHIKEYEWREVGTGNETHEHEWVRIGTKKTSPSPLCC